MKIELKEIKGLFEMDMGAPSPLVISNDTELYVLFYADKADWSGQLHERNDVYDKGIVLLKFIGSVKHVFGIPSNETIQGHPYYKLGLRSFGFFEVKNSPLIKELQNIQKVHPSYNPSKWELYKHFIISFHDNMFECVAREFEIREENVSQYHQAISLLNEMSINQI
jgi:hypothetical protein